MARLKDILEPGERVMLRSRLPYGAVWPPGLTVIGLILAFAGFRAQAVHPIPAGELKLILGGLGAVMALWGIMTLCVRAMLAGWMITDRRIIVLCGALRRASEAIALADIERAEFEGQILVLHRGDRTVRLTIGLAKLSRLQQALGPWGPPDGTAVEALDRMLDPRGEMELARLPSKKLRIVALLTIVLGCLAVAAIAGLAAAKGMGLMGLLPVLGFALIILPTAVGNSRIVLRWSAIVTDRGLFVRRPYDPAWCDLLPLSQIDSVEVSGKSNLLELKSNGRTVAQVASDPGAKERIHAAIEAAKVAAKPSKPPRAKPDGAAE